MDKPQNDAPISEPTNQHIVICMENKDNVEITREEFYKKFLKKCFSMKNTIFSSEELKFYWNTLTKYSIKSEAQKEMAVKHTVNPKHLANIMNLKIDGDKLVDKNGKELVCIEKIFDVLLSTHSDLGHNSNNGLEQLREKLNKKYYIPKYVYKNFLETCPECQEAFKKPTGPKPVFNKLVHLDWLNPRVVPMKPDENFHFILMVYDIETQFVLLRPLLSIETTEIANELLKIFMDFGMPDLAQCSGINIKLFQTACEFLYTNRLVMSNIKVLPKHHLAMANKCMDILDRFKSWIKDNDSVNWSIACYVIQNQLNNTTNFNVKPYNCVIKTRKAYSDSDDSDD